MTSKKTGFTMAEVLLTIAVIGAVVALTVPSLVSKHREVIIETKTLKAKQNVEQMVDIMLKQSGLVGIKKAPIMKCYEDDSNNCFSDETAKIFNIQSDSDSDGDLLDNLQAQSNVWNNVTYAFITKDGIIFGYEEDPITDDHGSNIGFNLVIDVNGKDKPNSDEVDIHRASIETPNEIDFH